MEHTFDNCSKIEFLDLTPIKLENKDLVIKPETEPVAEHRGRRFVHCGFEVYSFAL